VQVVAVRDLGGATAVGFISAAEGLGGVLGGVVAMRLRPRRLLLAGFLALGLMPVWVVSYVWPGALSGVMVGAVVGFAGLTFFGVCWDTALQDRVPHQLLARVSSWDILTSFVGMPVGNALAGPLADRFGSHPVLLVCALVLLVAGVAPIAARGTRVLTSAATDVAELRAQSRA
jgi:predicted MFS family arabinose efflux permease